MKKIISLPGIVLSVFVLTQAQDSLRVKKMNLQSILMVNTTTEKTDSTSFKTPKYKQGIFCDFEDKLNRKKVPIDFSLGKSKY